MEKKKQTRQKDNMRQKYKEKRDSGKTFGDWVKMQ